MTKSKKIKLSASQFKNVKRCPRFWWFDKVLNLKQPRTKALITGSNFHGIIEHILLETPFNKEYDEETIDMVVKAFETGCMDFDETEFYVEKKIHLEIDDIHEMTGFIDLLLVSPEIVTVVDHKTVSDFKWGLTKDDLKKDLQMMVYGKWVIDNYKVDTVRFRHNQILKKDATQSRKLVVEVTRNDIETYWKGLVKVSAYIDIFRKKKTSEEVKTCNGCNDYGGCWYKKEGHCEGHVDKKLQKKSQLISSKWIKK